MREIENFADERLDGCCIHCGEDVSKDGTWDHVPTKGMLSKSLRKRGLDYDLAKRKRGQVRDPDGYLPQVRCCGPCNSRFSQDENYLLCVLHALRCGTLRPPRSKFPESANFLRSNKHVVRALEASPSGQLSLFTDLKPFTIYADTDRISRVVLKNARGHAHHECAAALLGEPRSVGFRALATLSTIERERFEFWAIDGSGAVWPEVGSRSFLVMTEGLPLGVGGWIEVEKGRYRYNVQCGDCYSVRTVIWEYLATEVIW